MVETFFHRVDKFWKENSGQVEKVLATGEKSSSRLKNLASSNTRNKQAFDKFSKNYDKLKVLTEEGFQPSYP